MIKQQETTSREFIFGTLWLSRDVGAKKEPHTELNEIILNFHEMKVKNNKLYKLNKFIYVCMYCAKKKEEK